MNASTGTLVATFPPTDGGGLTQVQVVMTQAGSFNYYAKLVDSTSNIETVNVLQPATYEFALAGDKTSIYAQEIVRLTASMKKDGILTPLSQITGTSSVILLTGIKDFVGTISMVTGQGVLPVTLPFPGNYNFFAVIVLTDEYINSKPELKAGFNWRPASEIGWGTNVSYTKTNNVNVSVSPSPLIQTTITGSIITLEGCYPWNARTHFILRDINGQPLNDKPIEIHLVDASQDPSNFVPTGIAYGITGPNGGCLYPYDGICQINTCVPYTYVDYRPSAGELILQGQGEYANPNAGRWMVAYFAGDATHAPCFGYVRA